MGQPQFVDTTLRDGQQSLWAESMRTGMMLAVASHLDDVGYKGLEILSTSFLKKCVLELRENPWERLDLVSEKITRTPLIAMTQGNLNSFTRTPEALSELYFKLLAKHGIKIIQIMSPSNDMGFLSPERVSYAHAAGLKVTMALVYCLSPKHTDEYFVQKAREAIDLKVDTIFLKDPGGLLTPERAQSLVPTLLKNLNGMPLELHAHCTTGMAPIVCLESLKLGLETLHTAIPPLANGSSHPSIRNVLKNARALGYMPAVNEDAIIQVSDFLTAVAKREGLPIGTPVEYDYAQYLHQVPGGVISNLRHQLSKLRLDNKVDEILEETIRIRQDLGYPIMVTPFSQYVVTQASMNVMLGDRYKEVPDEIIQYALGYWGEEASSAIEPAIKEKILGRSRAEELSRWEIPEPSIREIRRKLGAESISEEELVLRYFIEEKEITAMHAAGRAKEYSLESPLLVLMRELAKQRDCSRISIQKEGYSLKLN